MSSELYWIMEDRRGATRHVQQDYTFHVATDWQWLASYINDGVRPSETLTVARGLSPSIEVYESDGHELTGHLKAYLLEHHACNAHPVWELVSGSFGTVSVREDQLTDVWDALQDAACIRDRIPHDRILTEAWRIPIGCTHYYGSKQWAGGFPFGYMTVTALLEAGE